MRLLNLSAVNFRGFGTATVNVAIGSDLVLFYGPNGHGKTSLAEAIEWLFYGATKRRKRGEAFSRTEYAGTYGNVHGGQPVEVSVRVRLRDGAEHVLTRRLRGGSEASVTFIDGTPADFSSLKIVAADSVYPVVAQHSLQSFIHTKPKERRDAMSEALGLQEFAALKTALDGARRSFQTSPPSSVIEARREIASYVAGFSMKAELQDLSRRWRQVTPLVVLPQDLAVIVAQAKELTGSASDDEENLLQLLRARRVEASNAVFETQKLTPKALVADISTALATKQQIEFQAFKALSESLTSLLGVALTTVSRELLSFWQSGLALAQTGDRCPMCEETTLTASQRDRLQQRLLQNQAYLQAHQRVLNTVQPAMTALIGVVDALSKGRLDPIDPQQRDILRGIMAGLDEPLESFLRKHDAVREAFQTLDDLRTEVENAFAAVSANVLDPEVSPVAITALNERRIDLIDRATATLPVLAAYSAAWEEVEKLLAGRIANTEAVTFIDAVGKTLKNRHLLRRIVRYDQILQISKLFMQNVEGTLQKKQDEILGVRGSEVVDIYNRLNPGAEVGFEAIEPGTDHLKLHAKSFGKRMSAAANLSQCQLNCLGLAVWLMQATTPSSPFDFILLDDTVQSMDDDHFEAFITSLVPFLLDHHKKQIIILSHLRPVIERIRNLNMDRDIRLYHFESYSIQGPTVVEQSEFGKRLAEIKGLADGNEDNRVLAVDRLRVLVEKFIRAVHLRKTGKPAPPEYDQAQPGQLLKLFLKIPGTTQKEYSGLDDTVDFADPAHHSDADYTPPQKSNIQPHIDRMTELINKYGLK
jgi:energy-coupling factor transporter ATP-binding protein EcfA2